MSAVIFTRIGGFFTSFSSTLKPRLVNFWTSRFDETLVVLVANLISRLNIKETLCSVLSFFFFFFYLKGILLALRRWIASTEPGMTLLSIWIVPLKSIRTPLIADMFQEKQRKEKKKRRVNYSLITKKIDWFIYLDHETKSYLKFTTVFNNDLGGSATSTSTESLDLLDDIQTRNISYQYMSYTPKYPKTMINLPFSDLTKNDVLTI